MKLTKYVSPPVSHKYGTYFTPKIFTSSVMLCAFIWKYLTDCGEWLTTVIRLQKALGCQWENLLGK